MDADNSRHAPPPPFEAYDGDQPYLFVSYAHADSSTVYPLIKRLGEEGFRIWYDDGIHAGSDWRDQIAEAQEGSALLVALLSPAAAGSKHVRTEIYTAMDEDVPVLPAYIEPADLPGGLRNSLRQIQAIFRTDGADNPFVAELAQAIERINPNVRGKGSGAARLSDAVSRLAVPEHFQDRIEQTREVARFLRNDAKRLLIVIGRGGMGKTAMVCRVLKELADGHLPDGLGALNIDGIVSLSTTGSLDKSGATRINALAVLHGLCDLLDERGDDLRKEFDNPYTDFAAKTRALLEAFPEGRVVLLLDNFEDLIDNTAKRIKGEYAELAQVLNTILTAPPHAVKVIVTTRFAPTDLTRVEVARQDVLRLNDGLPSPFAKDALRAMDSDGTLELRDAPDDVLEMICRRTFGHPRALEHVVGILRGDPGISPEDLFDDGDDLDADHVVGALVGEAYERLDPNARHVMEALAIYQRPVPAGAVEFLLQPYCPGLKPKPVLRRLAYILMVRREGHNYDLHPADRAYALDRIEEGEPADRLLDTPLYSRHALYSRAADYFKQVKKPTKDIETRDDLAPYEDEFRMRFAGRDYEGAMDVAEGLTGEILFRWGQYQMIVDLYTPLQNTVTDARRLGEVLRTLGAAYARMAKLRTAVELQERALKIAIEQDDPSAISSTQNGLGLRYDDMGRTRQAVECFVDAHNLAVQGAGDSSSPAMNLARCHARLDHGPQAEELYQNVLAYHRRTLSICNDPDWLEQRIAEEPPGGKSRAEWVDIVRRVRQSAGQSESNVLENLGLLRIDQGRLDEATEFYRQAVALADELAYAQIQNWARWGLALAMLLQGDPAGAREACQAALQTPVPENDHRVLALLGVTTLLGGDPPAARAACAEAIAKTNDILANCDVFYAALDSKALALCVGALCGDDGRLADANQAFAAARRINNDPAPKRRLRRILDALAPVDPDGSLANIRTTLDGP